jgi:hypothetical protein
MPGSSQWSCLIGPGDCLTEEDTKAQSLRAWSSGVVAGLGFQPTNSFATSGTTDSLLGPFTSVTPAPPLSLTLFSH